MRPRAGRHSGPGGRRLAPGQGRPRPVQQQFHGVHSPLAPDYSTDIDVRTRGWRGCRTSALSFENAISNIQISSENTTAARSRIMDTDFAAETANLTRSQILQQAGTAMLAQANQLPNNVLSLLQ